MSERKQHWEKVYADKSPLAVSWYQKEPLVSLQLIRNVGLAKDAAVIDVGGGASVLVDFLCAEGYSQVAVLDISATALASAKERFKQNSDKVVWHEADITGFLSPRRYSLWHDRAVFHFLTEASDREKYVDVLRRTLEPDGQLIMGAFAIGGPTKCSGLDIVQYDAAKLMRELGDDFELLEECSETHITPANQAQRFAYFSFVRKD
ncbi:MAG: SAM-dependent methyltransferase [Sedimenticola sp.]|nr:MAG: SAM-dependent methyltransferase [Sedimenticola sp.]